jgi:glucose/arabinose dehydrogenase
MITHSKVLGTLLAVVCSTLSGVAAGRPGDRFSLSPGNLPAPNTTHPDDINPSFESRPNGAMPQAPKGFAVSMFSPRLRHPRWLAVAPNGDVFVAEQGPGAITVLHDANGDGRAEAATIFATGYAMPHGLAFHDGALYVGDLRAIWRLPYRDGDAVARQAPQRVTVAPNLRPQGQHITRDIAFDSKGTLYLAMGGNADVGELPPPDATVQEIAPDGTMTTFASGLRNPVGIAFYPGTDDLWVTVNERDALGAQLPPDYMTRLKRGDFLGWPYAYIGNHPDPVFGAKRPDMVAKTKTPEILFQAHSAPLGLAFYDGSQFPAEYRGDAFVALHGTGPYDKPTGYKVVRVKFANGNPVGGYEDFVTGFWFEGSNPPRTWGTPAGLAVAKDGSLLIADETSGYVWRVAYTGQ